MPSFFIQQFKCGECSFYNKEQNLEKQSKTNVHIDNHSKETDEVGFCDICILKTRKVNEVHELTPT